MFVYEYSEMFTPMLFCCRACVCLCGVWGVGAGWGYFQWLEKYTASLTIYINTDNSPTATPGVESL